MVEGAKTGGSAAVSASGAGRTGEGCEGRFRGAEARRGNAIGSKCDAREVRGRSRVTRGRGDLARRSSTARAALREREERGTAEVAPRPPDEPCLLLISCSTPLPLQPLRTLVDEGACYPLHPSPLSSLSSSFPSSSPPSLQPPPPSQITGQSSYAPYVPTPPPLPEKPDQRPLPQSRFWFNYRVRPFPSFSSLFTLVLTLLSLAAHGQHPRHVRLLPLSVVTTD